MRIFLVTILIFSSITTFGQAKDGKVDNTKDTIVWLGGRKIGAVHVQVGSSDVTFSLPSRPDSTIRVERKQLEKIYYKSGRVEIFSKPVVQMVDETAWEAVTITKDKNQVEGMYKRGLISAKSSPSAKSKKAAQQNTYIKLQKKAAAVGGTIILITSEEYFGGFGDVAGCYIEGTAYGKEPLEKGTDVVKDKDKKPVK